MLSRDGVIARFVFAACFYFLAGSQMIDGWLATLSGLLGSVEMACGLLRYSPLVEFISSRQCKIPPVISDTPQESDHNWNKPTEK
ncbi:MAG: hypothetical protein GXY34_01890 [Syntrophomonadaceae bacterium]|nr:hypothetical protein [Syntrophomonadaceae bacterium]